MRHPSTQDERGQERPERAKPRVLLDVDGVLADFIGAVLDLAERHTGLEYTHADVDRFDFCAALGLESDVARSIKREIAFPGFCERLLPYDGARAGVRLLQELADVFIVTSPWNSSPTWVYEREAWLERHFKIGHARVLHGSAKHLVAGDWLVDDKTETLVAWQAAHPRGVAVQWRTPHNRRDGWTGRATDSWAELCSWIAELAANAPEPTVIEVEMLEDV